MIRQFKKLDGTIVLQTCTKVPQGMVWKETWSDVPMVEESKPFCLLEGLNKAHNLAVMSAVKLEFFIVNPLDLTLYLAKHSRPGLGNANGDLLFMGYRIITASHLDRGEVKIGIKV